MADQTFITESPRGAALDADPVPAVSASESYPANHNDPWDVAEIAAGLRAARDDWRAEHRRHAEHGHVGFPSRTQLERITTDLCAALFPLRLGPRFVRAENEGAFVVDTLQRALSDLHDQIRLELGYWRENGGETIDGDGRRVVYRFARSLPSLRRLLDTDVEAAYAGDPAARSVDEILLCYPSIRAIIHYRLAHRLHELGAPLVARIIAEVAHSVTGIDIHPGARIGGSFFIDHGSGVVIEPPFAMFAITGLSKVEQATCHHFNLVNTSNNHPPYECWLKTDGDYLAVKAVYDGRIRQLVELAEDRMIPAG
jgi:hypothetical protein